MGCDNDQRQPNISAFQQPKDITIECYAIRRNGKEEEEEVYEYFV